MKTNYHLPRTDYNLNLDVRTLAFFAQTFVKGKQTKYCDQIYT